MRRISPISVSDNATVTSVLDDMRARSGKAPNVMATIAQSPAAFNGYHALSKALMRGRLTTFTVRVIQERGLVDDAGVAVAREAGVDDSEIVANISLNALTSYNNRLVDTEIDFLVVKVEL